MSTRQFAVNTGASALNLVIQFAVNFFLTSYLVRTVGATAYGFFTLACTIVNYATIISNALNSMSARFVGYEYFNNNHKSAIKYYSSVLFGDLAFVITLAIPASFFIFRINHYLDVPPELVHDVRILFYIVFLNLCIGIGGAVFSVVYVIKNRLDLSSIRNVISNILRAVLLLAMYALLPSSIIYLGFASLAATLYVLVTNYVSSRKLLPEIRADIHAVSGKAIKEIAFSGMWNSFNQLSVILLHGLDLLICNQMVSPLAMGYLSVAMTMPNAVSSCISTFSYLFTPQFLEHFSKSEFELLRQDINNSIKFMTVISAIPISFLIGFGQEFYRLWVPDTNIKIVFILSALIILPNFTGGAINSVNYLYTVVNKVKWPAIVLSITGVLNVGIIFLLLKTTTMGVIAIVVVSAVLGLLRNIVFNAPYAAICIKQPFYVFYKEMAKSFGLLTLCCALCYLINLVLQPDSWLQLIIYGGGASCVLGCLVACIILSKSQRQFLISKLLRR